MVKFFSAVCAFVAGSLLALGQAPVPQRPDPLMNALMNQPRTDISSNVIATAEFDPPVVRPGELAVYRVTFNALEESVTFPEQLVAPAELNLRAGGRGQAMEFSGVGLTPRTCINYHARPGRAGDFTVPAFSVVVYGRPVTVPAARLSVTAQPGGTVQVAQCLAVEIAGTNLFVGQPVKIRVSLPQGAFGQMLSQVQVSGDSLFVDQGTTRQQFMQTVQAGRMVPQMLYETTVTPLRAGHLSLLAQGFSMANRFGGVVVLQAGTPTAPPGMPHYVLFDSEPVPLNVRSLPRDGQLPGFTGAIGHLSLDPPRATPATAAVGDTIKLTVTVRGEGSVVRLPAPPPPTAKDWQVFSGSAEPAPASPFIVSPGTPPNGDPGTATTFTYNLIPLSDSVRATPVIPFSYFDPVRSAYVALPIPSAPVTVKASLSPADLAVLQQADTQAGGEEKELVLSDLAASPGLTATSLVPVARRSWFPLVECAPGVAFALLLLWDRRRRYHEEHPEIRLRRRARRALRREWRSMRRAAQSGDATGYAAAAVAAMRQGCAPLCAAEPLALVGGDVVAVLPAPASPLHSPAKVSETPAGWFDAPGTYRPAVAVESPRADLVRRFFAVTDAARFGSVSADAQGLLPLAPEVDKLLAELEAALCA